MALYREGKAAMAADGTVTGTGTKWQSSLSLIRPGATIMFLSSPIQMAVVNKVVSDTEIKAITTKGAVVASSDYAILLSDSLTVDGLAQDVAETLRYYQSQETVIADAVEFFKTFDFESLQNLANQIKADSEAAGASATAAAASESAAKTSETNAKASENKAKTSETNAKASETAAKTSETNAKASETAAKTSEANAKSSENKAKTSETNAEASETAAKTSETNAKASETAAKTSETNAKASETAAKTSETNAKASENAAKTSEVAAETARDQVQQIIDNAGEQSTLVALAQPNGSKNIGGLGYVNPQMFGGIGKSPNTDNTTAVMTAIAEAVSRGCVLDLSGGPWRVTKTLDLTLVKNIRTDYTGRILVNPDNFTPLHAANFVVTLGNPDTTFGADRCTNTCIVGTLYVFSDHRNTALNGVFVKGALLNFGAIRANNFNGYGVRFGAVWDSTAASLSVELCGNTSNHALSIEPFGDTSNCLNIGRIQCERAYHKQMLINVIRSEIHNIHAERLFILTESDGATGLPSGLTYENSYFLLSNSEVSHLVLDAMESTSVGTVNTTPSVRLSLYEAKAATLSVATCVVTSTYGQCSTIDNSTFYKYYNNGYTVTLTSCRFTAGDHDGLLSLGGAGIVANNCVIDTFRPNYGTKKLLLSGCTLNNDYSNTKTDVSGVLLDACTLNGNIKETGPDAVKEPTEFRNCRVNGAVLGFYQHKFIMNGGYAASVNLVSRSFAELNNVRGETFNYNGDRGFITKGCEFGTVTAWGTPVYGNYKVGKRTQRMGAMSSGDGIEFVNTTDNGATFTAVVNLP
ncbi:hypothetical protein MHMKNFAF_00045 [Klebsiella phage vB_KpnS_2146-302]|nr:hypothetical protein MHMKNFAF_00045 [Klebsiella phage vB_KpnS_2146-302]